MPQGRYDLPALASTPRPARVLVVDDDSDNRTLLGDSLTREGYLVAAAEDGPTALGRLSEGDIDLVILDVRMPGMDGLEVCKRIRAQPRFERIPIIFLTANQADELREAAGLEAGGDEYLFKPFSRKVLALGGTSCLANAEREQQLLAQVAHRKLAASAGGGRCGPRNQ